MTTDAVVRMPKLADTLVEGTLGRWLKQVGETVAPGEALASIETDKVTTDITSPTAGTLLEIMVPEGQTVAIETPLARIGEGTASEPSPEPPVVGPPKPTPVAARLLVEHGVSPTQVPTRGSRLKKSDVLNFVQSQGGARVTARPELVEGRAGEPARLSQMRRAIAEHMTKAYQTIPHGQTVMEADLTQLVAWREARKLEGVKFTFTVLFVYALGRQLAKVVDAPVDVGVAVALDKGLIVPVVRGVDRLTLEDVAREVADLAQRARANQLQPGDLQGGRMTLTNVGSFGNLTASPIIPLGQLGILGPGIVDQRPLPGPDLGVRLGWRCLLSFVYDRRVFNDFDADRFLRGVIEEVLTVPPR